MDPSFEAIAETTAADNKEYKEHSVFKDLERAIDFYDRLDFSVMGFVTIGTPSVINIDSMVYSSIKATLESIKMVLQKGHIGDAFCLLRKYYDLCILNLYTNVYLDKNISATKLTVDEVVQWMHGKKKLPHKDFRAMLPYLQSSGKSKEILELLFSDNSYKKTRDRCNDHTHYNYFDTILVNDSKMYYLNRLKRLNLFQKDLENIFILHLSSIFHIKDHYMSSSDYMDALEFGASPEEGSQYWVADFIQTIFNELISVKRKDVADFIKTNTAMQLQ